MRLSLAVAAAVVLAPALAVADPVLTKEDALREATGLVQAFDQQSSDTLRAAFASRVRIRGLTFTDAACKKAFGGDRRRTITRKAQARLAACLQGASWRPTASAPAPFVERLGKRWRFSAAGAVGFLVDLELSPRKDGSLQLDSITVEEEEGGVENGDMNGVEGGVAGGVAGGDLVQPVTIERVPPPPPGPPPPQNVPPTAVEANRLTGSKLIAPNDKTKEDIAASGKAKIVGSFKMCLDEAGAVSKVAMLKSTGFGAYDSDLSNGIKTWTYRPYLVNGKAISVCTAVTFIYSQK